MNNKTHIVERHYPEMMLDVFIPSQLPNVFREMTPENHAIPIYDEIKDKLPVPFLNGHENVVKLYYKAWEIAFSNIKKCEKGAVSNFIDTAFNDVCVCVCVCFLSLRWKFAQISFRFMSN